MYKDFTSHVNGRVYRIFPEGPTPEHPCESMAIVFDVSDPARPFEVHREKGSVCENMDKLVIHAKDFLKSL